MIIDLHTHSTASDGSLSPIDLLRAAKTQGVEVLSLTDHDTVSGIEEASRAARDLSMEFIPGIEFSTEVEESEIHILGYWIDTKNPTLLALLRRLKRSRLRRIYHMVARLKKMGLVLNVEEIIQQRKMGVYGRPQVASALRRRGYVSSIEEAFEKYIGITRPAYVPHFKLSPWQAVRLIIKSSGIPVYAHPGLSRRDDLIPSLLESGLQGIEVFYPEHSPADVQRYLKIARDSSLLVTGGSDYHGESGNPSSLGIPDFPAEFYRVFRSCHF